MNDSRALKLYEKFFIYGGIGWCIELIFTSIASQVEGDGDITLRGYSYLWMPFIWGTGTILVERVGQRVKDYKWYLRGSVYALVCFGVEYAAGILLYLLTHRIPWDYSKSMFSVNGAIRLDYFPFWFLAGLAAEKIYNIINRVEIRNDNSNTD